MRLILCYIAISVSWANFNVATAQSIDYSEFERVEQMLGAASSAPKAAIFIQQREPDMTGGKLPLPVNESRSQVNGPDGGGSRGIPREEQAERPTPPPSTKGDNKGGVHIPGNYYSVICIHIYILYCTIIPEYILFETEFKYSY